MEQALTDKEIIDDTLKEARKDHPKEHHDATAVLKMLRNRFEGPVPSGNTNHLKNLRTKVKFFKGEDDVKIDPGFQEIIQEWIEKTKKEAVKLGGKIETSFMQLERVDTSFVQNPEPKNLNLTTALQNELASENNVWKVKNFADAGFTSFLGNQQYYLNYFVVASVVLGNQQYYLNYLVVVSVVLFVLGWALRRAGSAMVGKGDKTSNEQQEERALGLEAQGEVEGYGAVSDMV